MLGDRRSARPGRCHRRCSARVFGARLNGIFEKRDASLGTTDSTRRQKVGRVDTLCDDSGITALGGRIRQIAPAESAGKLSSAGDAEFFVDVGQVLCDGFCGHEERLSDLAVGHPSGSHPGYA